MLRIRGFEYGDRIGWQQESGLDVNGDRIDDVFIASPHVDFGNVTRAGLCRGDFNRDGTIDQTDVSLLSFNRCQQDFGEHLFSDDACKVFDYDNDEDIDEDDRCVFCCLSNDCQPDPSCVFGRGTDCCGHLVDNGFIGVIFGGERINGDRVVTGDRETSQLATSELPGTIFYGNCALDRAGFDISSAGDFNQDGFGDLLIAAPGEVRCDRTIPTTCDAEERERTCREAGGRERLGVVYLIFGGIHLTNTAWSLKDVGSEELPGIVFLSPYVKGRPNEAAPTAVANIGDINNDGFGDIAIGNPKADFIDPTFPQGPDAPGSDPATGRRSDVGDAYIIYGSNFGSNRAVVP
jgi:hypothetical protein